MTLKINPYVLIICHAENIPHAAIKHNPCIADVSPVVRGAIELLRALVGTIISFPIIHNNNSHNNTVVVPETIIPQCQQKIILMNRCGSDQINDACGMTTTLISLQSE